MKYFKIVNWEKYQHRDVKDHKSMVWIKCYTGMLVDPKLRQLSPCEFGLWVKLMLFVGQIGNKVPHDPPYIRSCLALVNFKKKLPLPLFEELGLIQVFETSEKPRIRKERKKERAVEREPGSLESPVATSEAYRAAREALKKM